MIDGVVNNAPSRWSALSARFCNLLVVTGAAETIEAARDAANALADKVLVANTRYRRDIGAQLIECDLSKIESWGMLDTD